MSGPPRRSRYRAALVFVALFICGGVAGATGMRAYMLDQLRVDLRGHQGLGHHRLRAMARTLELSDEQRIKIAAIVDEAATKRAEAIRSCRPAVEKLREEIDARIVEVLTPAQRDKYESFKRDHPRRHKGRRGKGR